MKNRAQLIKDSRANFAKAVQIRSAGNKWDQYRKAREYDRELSSKLGLTVASQSSIWEMVRNARKALEPFWSGHMFYGPDCFYQVIPWFGVEA
jgi:hypothetical protein